MQDFLNSQRIEIIVTMNWRWISFELTNLSTGTMTIYVIIMQMNMNFDLEEIQIIR